MFDAEYVQQLIDAATVVNNAIWEVLNDIIVETNLADMCQAFASIPSLGDTITEVYLCSYEDLECRLTGDYHVDRYLRKLHHRASNFERDTVYSYPTRVIEELKFFSQTLGSLVEDCELLLSKPETFKPY